VFFARLIEPSQSGHRQPTNRENRVSSQTLTLAVLLTDGLTRPDAAAR